MYHYLQEGYMHQNSLPESITDLLISQPIELPIFHPVALKLQRMLSDKDFVVDEVSKVANEDQALASHMLKMANSPMYMGRTKVATIKEATMRLGAQQVINIAIAASQASAHASADPVLNFYMDELWVHSHGSALGARWLAHNNPAFHATATATFNEWLQLIHDGFDFFLAITREDKLGVAMARG